MFWLWPKRKMHLLLAESKSDCWISRRKLSLWASCSRHLYFFISQTSIYPTYINIFVYHSMKPLKQARLGRLPSKWEHSKEGLGDLSKPTSINRLIPPSFCWILDGFNNHFGQILGINLMNPADDCVYPQPSAKWWVQLSTRFVRLIPRRRSRPKWLMNLSAARWHYG